MRPQCGKLDVVLRGRRVFRQIRGLSQILDAVVEIQLRQITLVCSGRCTMRTDPGQIPPPDGCSRRIDSQFERLLERERMFPGSRQAKRPLQPVKALAPSRLAVATLFSSDQVIPKVNRLVQQVALKGLHLRAAELPISTDPLSDAVQQPARYVVEPFRHVALKLLEQNLMLFSEVHRISLP